MEYRSDSKFKQRVSLLGLGAMRFPLLPDGRIDASQAREMIDAVCRGGVNYFDTAYTYHNGESEGFLGDALSRYPRDSYLLADKLPTWDIHSRQDAERIFLEQLARCRTDYFDFYLCHSVNSLEDFIRHYEDTRVIDYLLSLRERGAVRRLGFSYHGSTEDLKPLAAKYPWDFAQLQLNYVDWTLQNAAEKYDILERNRMQCVVMESVRGGSLAALCSQAAEILQAARPERSPASWAIRFAASLPNVLTVLSGMSTLEQVRDNLATMSDFAPLSADERETLEKAKAAYFQYRLIPCTACRYCSKCPAGVDIAGIFAAYNRGAEAAASGDYREFVKAYSKLPEAARADRCVGCRKCVSYCPQSISIPERLAKVGRLFTEKR